MDFLNLALISAVGVLTIVIASFFLVRVILEPRVALAIGLIFAALSISEFGHPSLRYAILIVTLPHLLTAIKKAKDNARVNLPRFLIPSLYVGVCFLSSIWSLNAPQTLLSAIAWIILLLFVFTFTTLVDAKTLKRTVFFILALILFLSLVTLLTHLGWEKGRAKGIFTNANGAGVFTFFAIATSYWMNERWNRTIILIGLIYLLLTGSRASLLAAAVIVFVMGIVGRNPRTKALIVASALVFGVPIWSFVTSNLEKLESLGIVAFRTNNSRESVWGGAFEFIAANPLLGAGYRATPGSIGSSTYIKLVAEFGFLFAFFGLLLIAGYVWWSRGDYVMLGLTLGSLVNVTFEDWLLTAGSPMLIFYLTLIMSVSQTKISNRRFSIDTWQRIKDTPVAKTYKLKAIH